MTQHGHLGDLLAAGNIRVELQEEEERDAVGQGGEGTLTLLTQCLNQLTSFGSTLIPQSSQTWPGILEGERSAHHTVPSQVLTVSKSKFRCDIIPQRLYTNTLHVFLY